MENNLPVGSVVLLKGGTRGVVIIGYAAVEQGSKKIWDYLGCAYPMGVVNSDQNLLFNKDQIAQVIFTGYIEEEGKKILKSIQESLEEAKK